MGASEKKEKKKNFKFLFHILQKINKKKKKNHTKNFLYKN
jgi:hypothetical protein